MTGGVTTAPFDGEDVSSWAEEFIRHGGYMCDQERAFTLLDLLAAVETATTTHIDPVFTSPRAGDVRHSFADLSNIARDLGYKPAVGLTDGMRRTVEWFVAHEQSGSAGD